MRKVFLDEIPKRPEGIDWQKSVGHTVYFVYDNIEGKIKIVEYNKNKLKISYKNKNHIITTYYFKHGRLAHVLGLVNNNHIFKIGDIIETKTGKIQIKELIRIKGTYSRRGYIYKCLIDGYESTKSEFDIKRGSGCPVCNGHKVKIGYNDLCTTHPELSKLLLNIEDGYKYTKGSDKKVYWKCPKCNNVMNISISSVVYQQGISCPACSDGFSYSEKFIYSLLKQQNILFFAQTGRNILTWCKSFRYDFYIPNLNCIIESHGLQHYEETRIGSRNLMHEQENDKIKRELALINGIKYYIVIDCRYSTINYIKNNIMNSLLPNILNFKDQDIDWRVCEINTTSSMVKIVCDLYTNNKNINDIAEELSINKATVRKYLCEGAKFNWCTYDPKIASKNNLMNMSKNNCIKVICINTQEIFQSIKSIKNKYNVHLSRISYCCKKKIKTDGKHPETGEKLVWMYLDEWEQLNTEEKQNKINEIREKYNGT